MTTIKGTLTSLALTVVVAHMRTPKFTSRRLRYPHPSVVATEGTDPYSNPI